MNALVFELGPHRGTVVDARGTVFDIPFGWEHLPPGDAGLTRRVKAAATTWAVIERRGRKKFSRGLYVAPGVIARVKAALDAERDSPAWAKKREGDLKRRQAAQAQYVADFEAEVLAFLAFSEPYWPLENAVAKAVTVHATPVGSGTVARTKRIELDRRAEAAVIAWLRHQTTAYDSMHIARIKGERREVRRELARVSRALLARHQHAEAHAVESCPLCRWHQRFVKTASPPSPPPEPTAPLVPPAGSRRVPTTGL